MSPKKSVEQEINEFLEKWDCEQMRAFLRDIIPLFELYDVEDENDWLNEVVSEEDKRNVRLIRTVYLVSRIAENHSGILAHIRMNHRRLWERLEKNQMT